MLIAPLVRIGVTLDAKEISTVGHGMRLASNTTYLAWVHKDCFLPLTPSRGVLKEAQFTQKKALKKGKVFDALGLFMERHLSIAQ